MNGNPFAWPNGQTDATVYVNDWDEDGVLYIIQGNYIKNVWVFLGISLGIENFNSQVFGAEVSITLHSNPLESSLAYSVSSEQPVPVSVSLWGMDGRMVKVWDLGTLQGPSDHTHAVSDLPSGVYTMVILVNDEISSRQVAIIR